MKVLEKLLEVNGKKISIITKDGIWWVAIRPICEVLGVDYHAQYKNLQGDEILSQLLSNQTTVGADNKLRKMVCLPEKYVYGWLFSIRSDSTELKEYKLQCYDILYNHFHGTLTGRMNTLTIRSEIDTEIAQLEQKLKESAEYKKIEALKKKKTATNTRLKELDQELLRGQISLSFPS